MSARTPLPRSAPRLRWDDGLNLEGTILWFDAPRRRDLCFLSHAAVDLLPVHHKVLATAQTFRLLEGRLGEAQQLPCPCFRPFFLGELELELLPAGFLPGSAQLLVTWRGTRILYAADIAMRPARAAEAIRIHRCDLLVMSCTLGDPALRLPPRDELEQQLLAFVQESLARERPPVLLTDRLGLAQELLHLLGEAGVEVRCHRSIAAHGPAYAALGHPVPATALRGPLLPHQALIWPLALHDAPALLRARPRARLALVGEQALLGAAEAAAGGLPTTEARFPLTLHASFDELLAYVQAADPRRVLLHRGRVAPFSEALRRRGHDAEALLPPAQTTIGV